MGSFLRGSGGFRDPDMAEMVGTGAGQMSYGLARIEVNHRELVTDLVHLHRLLLALQLGFLPALVVVWFAWNWSWGFYLTASLFKLTSDSFDR